MEKSLYKTYYGIIRENLERKKHKSTLFKLFSLINFNKPGGQEEKRNVRSKPIAKTQEEYDNFMKFSKVKREELKKRIQNEQKIVNYNQKSC